MCLSEKLLDRFFEIHIFWSVSRPLSTSAGKVLILEA
jgi:hypothetical protein